MLEVTQTTQDIPYQNISNNTSTSGYIDKLIVFLETYCCTFPQKYTIQIDEAEEDISEKLYLHLQRQSRLTEAPFEFQPETPQKPISKKGYKRRADFGVNLNTYDVDMELIYCIEAKRLPTGKGEREKEYLFSKKVNIEHFKEKGGIQRFKNNEHGISRDGKYLLERNGMVGYVQQNDFYHWHKTINEWISNEPNWDNTEALEKIDFSTIAKLKSEHKRVTGENLYLTHFWINLCQTKI